MIASPPQIDQASAVWSQPAAVSYASSSANGLFFVDDGDSVRWLRDLAKTSTASDAMIHPERSSAGVWVTVQGATEDSVSDDVLRQLSDRVTVESYRRYDALPSAFNAGHWTVYSQSGAIGYWHSLDRKAYSDLPAAADAQVHAVRSELISYAELHPGWDGAGSIAPRVEAVEEVIAFLDALHIGDNVPEPMVAADGEIGLFWSFEGGYIDVSFKGLGALSYYAKVNGKVAKGQVPFNLTTAIPEDLLTAIHSV